jgi:hypothetical protein
MTHAVIENSLFAAQLAGRGLSDRPLSAHVLRRLVAAEGYEFRVAQVVRVLNGAKQLRLDFFGTLA